MDITYETGIKQLDTYIFPGHPDFDSYSLHKNNLRLSIQQARLFGDTPTLKHEQSRLIYELNQISLRVVGTAFTDLNLGVKTEQKSSRVPIENPISPPADEVIVDQQRLLITHRRTLAILLQQKAQLTSAYTPPGIISGIAEAREHIRHIKQALREWGVTVDEEPNDEPALERL